MLLLPIVSLGSELHAAKVGTSVPAKLGQGGADEGADEEVDGDS